MRLLSMLCLLLALTVATPSWAAEGKTLQEAIAQVERDTGGKVLSAETIKVGKNVVYRIKVLTPDGRVRVVQVPA